MRKFTSLNLFNNPWHAKPSNPQFPYRSLNQNIKNTRGQGKATELMYEFRSGVGRGEATSKSNSCYMKQCHKTTSIYEARLKQIIETTKLHFLPELYILTAL